MYRNNRCKTNSVILFEIVSVIRWTEDEISSLSWNYMQCNTMQDVIGEIVKIFKEDGIYKSRKSVIRELLNQFMISNEEFDNFMKVEMERNCNGLLIKKEIRDNEIGKLCEQLAQDGKSKFLDWVQSVLLDTCTVKIYLEKRALNTDTDSSSAKKGAWMDQDGCNHDKHSETPVMSPVSYHSLCKY